MHFQRFTLFLFVYVLASLQARTYYVSPAGTASGDGYSFNNAYDFKTALSKVAAADTLLLKGGTYTIPHVQGSKNTLIFSKSGVEGKPIYVIAGDDAKAVFDFSYPAYAWIQNGFGFDVSGSYWYFKGLVITRAGYQGAYVTGAYNTFVNCSFSYCKFSGLEINKGGSYTTVINCDSYLNYNVKVISGQAGAAADGFAPKQTQGPGNVLIGCRAWENSDDGYDTFDSPETVVFENCWAFNNGYVKVGDSVYTGNKVGFKLGGNGRVQNNKVYNCVAFGNGYRGFDENNNKGGIALYNCLAYNNIMNYSFGGTLNSGQKHDLRNNISLKEQSASKYGSGSVQMHNTWNSGFAVKDTDFKSLDVSLASASRDKEGALPQTALFRLKETSALVDAGTLTGRPFTGNAPDIGPFETSVVTSVAELNFENDVTVFPTVTDSEVHIRLLSIRHEASYVIHSSKGEALHAGVIEASQVSVSCAELPSGWYMLSVKNSGKVMTFKFMKP